MEVWFGVYIERIVLEDEIVDVEGVVESEEGGESGWDCEVVGVGSE